MNSVEGAKLAIEALNDIGVPYMIVGSLSSNYYAVPRATRDADFVIETDEKIAELRAKLAGAFVADEQIGFETMLMTTKYLFHQRTTAFRLEVFVLSSDPFDRSRFGRRIERDFDGVRTFIPTPEDVIVQKIRWGRRKDMDDVRDILHVSGDGLDWAYIRSWTDRHGTTGLLDRVRSGVSVAED